MQFDQLIRQLGATQHGLVTRDQLTDVGLSARDLQHRLRLGVLIRLSPCVIAIGGTPDTPSRQAMAAVLDVGDEAALSHSSGAAWWQVPGFALAPLQTTRLRGGRARPSHLSTVHQPRQLTESQLTVLHGIPVTTPARTIFDLAGTEPYGRTERALDYMLSRRLTTTAELHHLLQMLARKGRSGISVMRDLLADRPLDMRHPETNLEKRFRELALRAGIVELESQVDIADATGWIARVDFLHRTRRIIFEIDSVIHHSSVIDRRRDGATTARLCDAGYEVVRFDETQVFFDTDAVTTTLRAIFFASGSTTSNIL
jgi:very-short-patch-repair endonuclease